MSERSNNPIPDGETLLAIIDREQKRLASDPNVVGVGLGSKIRGGKHIPGVAIVYAVRVKLTDEAEMRRIGTERIPDTVDGIWTDVYVPTVDRPHAPTGSRGTGREDPLVGGTSTTVLSSWHSFPTGYGTLGSICFDVASGDAMALSNAHVWGEDLGRDVIQPMRPVGEYLEASVKYLACGPILSYFVDLTPPSIATIALTVGAGAVWSAAICSDDEDPSRWGQGQTIPPAGSNTDSERIGVSANAPEQPFPGYPYRTEVRWDYTRFTDRGDLNASIVAERENRHVVIAKRVWSDRQQYGGGERVRICGELITTGGAREDYHVIAYCFPTNEPDRVVLRVLRPGICEIQRPTEWECFQGFPLEFAERPDLSFPLHFGIFRFDSRDAAQIIPVQTDNFPDGMYTLRVPLSGLRIHLVPTRRVTVDVSHAFLPVTVSALDPLGRVVASATSSATQHHLETLTVEADLIEAVIVAGGGGEGFLHGVCRQREDIPDDGHSRFIYVGHVDLAFREVPSRWGVLMSAQTVDNSPAGTDPIDAAKNIAGLTATREFAQLAGCALVMSLDHVFDVI